MLNFFERNSKKGLESSRMAQFVTFEHYFRIFHTFEYYFRVIRIPEPRDRRVRGAAARRTEGGVTGGFLLFILNKLNYVVLASTRVPRSVRGAAARRAESGVTVASPYLL